MFNTNFVYCNMEEYKNIKGYEGLYQISNYGNVRSLDRVIKSRYGTPKKWKGKEIKKIVDSLGYERVSLCKDGKVKAHKIHRLVAQSFLNSSEYTFINHKDGNKTNNHIDNLEWCDYKMNHQHALDNNLKGKKRCKVKCKETNKIFDSQAEASRFYNLSHTMLSAHLKGECKTFAGYTFEKV